MTFNNRQAAARRLGPGSTTRSGYLAGVIVIVDVANVLGSRPDGWWRDRAGAAARLLDRIAVLPGSDVVGADGQPIRIDRVIAVVEGAARTAPSPTRPVDLTVVRAERDGDSAIVALAHELPADLLVVTADRGLRQRLPASAAAAGPNWLNALIGR